MEESGKVIRSQNTFKVLVIGDPGTGKTSIIRRYVHNVYTNNYKTTIGVDFALKVVVVNSTEIVHLQMWDISGQDRYGVMTRVYYKDAHAAVIVLDSAREQTVEGALRWKTDLDQKVTLSNGKPIPTILLANKTDMTNDMTDEKLVEIQKNNGFLAAFRTSAKTSKGIEEAFEKLVEVIQSTENDGSYEPLFFNRDGNVRLGEIHIKKSSPSCCSSF